MTLATERDLLLPGVRRDEPFRDWMTGVEGGEGVAGCPKAGGVGYLLEVGLSSALSTSPSLPVDGVFTSSSST